MSVALRLVLLVLCLGFVLAHPILGDLFGDDGFAVADDPETTEVLPVPRPPRLPIRTKDGLVDILPNMLPTTATRRTKTSSASLIATILNSQPTTSGTTGLATTPVPVLSGVSPTSTLAAAKDASSSPSSTATQWEIIGFATIGIALVAGFLLCFVYFDSIWGCLLAAVGKKRNKGSEDLVPDWARGEWEFKIASEDGHRYPTMASLESMTKTTSSPTTTPDPHSLVPSRPPSLYLEPHPLEPLFRRPSASNHPKIRA
ncbi:hypothetical protein C8F01DRAFT_1107896 [Mycena amicta]|nr:hypothetical protein C8F01DRAFT_1107896 [Mycena amicta]